MEKTTYIEVGKKAGLTGTTLLRYTYYMLARWADSEQEKCFFGYAEEWAERFKHKREYEASDHFGQGVLRQIDADLGLRTDMLDKLFAKKKEEGLDVALEELFPKEKEAK